MCLCCSILALIMVAWIYSSCWAMPNSYSYRLRLLTGRSQLVNARNIAVVEAALQLRLLFELLDSNDTASRTVSNFDSRAGTRRAECAWSFADSISFKDCCKHFFDTLSKRLLVSRAHDNNTDFRNIFDWNERAHNNKFTKIGTENLLSPAIENVAKE